MTASIQTDARPHLVIVGGGFAGMYLAKSLRRSDFRITLIDRTNYHLFQPLLYQVATGGVSPGDIAAPLRSVLSRQTNVEVLLAEMVDLDLEAREVVLSDDRIRFDYLVVAVGMRTGYFGHHDWQDVAPGMKTLEDALQIRRRILGAFEEAEREPSPERRAALMRMVVVGGGPTGVELAGAVAELARNTLAHDFRHIQPRHAEVILVEGAKWLLPPFPDSLRDRAAKDLEKLGVTLYLGTHVTHVEQDHLTLEGPGGATLLDAHTILWAAGVEASPLGRVVAAAAGVETDRAGRVKVNADMTVGAYDTLFVIGDLAALTDVTGTPVPGLASAAMQQGRHLAANLKRRLAGQGMQPFRYRDKGALAVIGRHAAVARIGGLRLKGFVAWLIWLFVHISFLVEFNNKLMVLTQWAWNYITWKRGARLITYGRPQLHGQTTPNGGDREARRQEDAAPGAEQAAKVANRVRRNGD